MKTLRDKNGKLIKAGDRLYNPTDENPYHYVIEDPAHNLYLDDYDSPLEKYRPEDFWEIRNEGRVTIRLG